MSRLARLLLHAFGRRGPRGQSLVEFALTLPFFLLITVGVVDLGRGIVANTLVSNAAHEGARAGIFPAATGSNQSTANASIVTAVNSQGAFLGSIPDSPDGIANVSSGTYMKVSANTLNASTNTYTLHSPSQNPPTERTSGSQIIVEVHYRFFLITPLISRLVGNNINLSATSTMMIE